MKPWDYQVCAAIPVLGSPEAVKVCIDILRCQTERPYIVLVDTGSNPDDFAEIEAMRADDCEVHTIRTRATIHPHDNVASAMDLVFSLCRSRYLFATHADCFLKRRELLAEMGALCKTQSPIVGYGMSPRTFPAYRWMISHVCTMFDMKVMDHINARWCQRRLVVQEGDDKTRVHEPKRAGWPDTDLLWNYQAHAAGITPYRIGREPRNDTSFEDQNIEHSREVFHAKRSPMAATRLYAAIGRAYDRLAEWNLDVPRLAKLATTEVTLVTATSDRPEAFRLCEKWMARQTYSKPLQWIVVDDGKTPIVPTMGQHYIRREPGLPPTESLVENVRAAIPHIQGDVILFIEDDDWYSPSYVKTMAARLSNGAMIAGEAQSQYYSVSVRQFHQCLNSDHSSLCQTGMHRSAMPHLEATLNETKTAFFDLRLWSRISASENVNLSPTTELCIGIKGMPGKGGIGIGHRLPPDHCLDLDCAVLRKWIGRDADEYERYWQGRPAG